MGTELTARFFHRYGHFACIFSDTFVLYHTISPSVKQNKNICLYYFTYNLIFINKNGFHLKKISIYAMIY